MTVNMKQLIEDVDASFRENYLGIFTVHSKEHSYLPKYFKLQAYITHNDNPKDGHIEGYIVGVHNKSAGIPQEWELVRVHMPIVDFCRHYPDVDPKMLAKDDMDKHTSTILDALTGVFFGGMYR